MKRFCTILALGVIIAAAGCKSEHPKLSKEQLEKGRLAYDAIYRLQHERNGSDPTYELRRMDADKALDDYGNAPSAPGALLQGSDLWAGLKIYMMSVEGARAADHTAYMHSKTNQQSKYDAEAREFEQAMEACRIAVHNLVYTPIEPMPQKACSEYSSTADIKAKATAKTAQKP